MPLPSAIFGSYINSLITKVGELHELGTVLTVISIEPLLGDRQLTFVTEVVLTVVLEGLALITIDELAVHPLALLTVTV